MGISGGSSNGSSQSSGYGYSTNLAQSATNVWGGQSGALTSLYDKAQGQAGQGVDPSISAASAGGVNALAKIAGGTTPLDGFADPSSAAGKAMMASIASGVGDNFNKVILPGLTSAAGQAGALGGSRDGLAKGVAASDAQSQIMNAAYAQASQAAAGKTDAMLSAGTSLPGAALQQYGLSWAPLGQLAGILGGPTVLSASQAGGQSENWNSSQSSQRASQFGFNFF